MYPVGVCGVYVCVYSVCVCGFQVCAWTVCEVGGRSTNGTLIRPPSSPLSPSPRRPASTVSISPSLDYMYTHTPLNKTLGVVLVPPQKLVTNMTSRAVLSTVDCRHSYYSSHKRHVLHADISATGHLLDHVIPRETNCAHVCCTLILWRAVGILVWPWLVGWLVG